MSKKWYEELEDREIQPKLDEFARSREALHPYNRTWQHCQQGVIEQSNPEIARMMREDATLTFGMALTQFRAKTM